MRRLVLLAFLLAVSAPLCAEDGRLFPSEVFVGDAAELTFRCPALASVLDEGVAVTLAAADVPVTEDVDISSVTALKSGGNASVTIAFVPWVTGTVSFPSLSIRGVSVSPPAARIASIAEKTGKTALERERSPLLVPGTTWLLYAVIAAALAAVALAVFLAVRLRAFLLSPGEARGVRRRARILERALRSLERKADSADGAQWYRAYARAVRQYLGARFAGNFDAFLSLTGTEIAAASDAAFSGRVADLFSDLDAVRFGGASLDGSSLGGTSLGGGAIAGDGPASGDAASSRERTAFLFRARELSADIEAALEEASANERPAVERSAVERAANANPSGRGGDNAGL